MKNIGYAMSVLIGGGSSSSRGDDRRAMERERNYSPCDGCTPSFRYSCDSCRKQNYKFRCTSDSSGMSDSSSSFGLDEGAGFS